MKINRKQFWKGYHRFFDAYGSTTQPTVDALNAILDKFETEKRLKNLPQFAYVLATAFHESGIKGNHFVPVKEGKARKGSEVWEKYQKKYWDTGYYGRGLIQTTWESGYRAVGKLLGVGEKFVENPDLLLTVEWAYEALVGGMTAGIYRRDSKGRQTLDRYFKDDDATLAVCADAREIVNGDKKKNGLKIAHYAMNFISIFESSAEEAALPAVRDEEMQTQTIEPEVAAAEQTAEAATTDAETTTTSETIFQKVEKIGDTIKTSTQKITDIKGNFAPISKASWFMTGIKLVFAAIAAAYGFARENWELILFAFGCLLLAAFLFNEAKKRAWGKQAAIK